MWMYASSGRSGLTKPTRKPTEPAVAVLGDPRRPGEVLEPQAQEQLVHVPPAPPVVDVADEPRVIGLDRPAQPDVAAHRAPIQAAIAATTSWPGTSGPNDLGEIVERRQHAALDPGVLPQPELADDHGTERDQQRDADPPADPPGAVPAPTRRPRRRPSRAGPRRPAGRR